MKSLLKSSSLSLMLCPLVAFAQPTPVGPGYVLASRPSAQFRVEAPSTDINNPLKLRLTLSATSVDLSPATQAEFDPGFNWLFAYRSGALAGISSIYSPSGEWQDIYSNFSAGTTYDGESLQEIMDRTPSGFEIDSPYDADRQISASGITVEKTVFGVFPIGSPQNKKFILAEGTFTATVFTSYTLKTYNARPCTAPAAGCPVPLEQFTLTAFPLVVNGTNPGRTYQQFQRALKIEGKTTTGYVVMDMMNDLAVHSLSARGDVTKNNGLNNLDVVAVQNNAGSTNLLYDIDSDLDVDADDVTYLINFVIQPIDGDFDCNGSVGSSDLTVWRANMGSTTAHACMGDGDRDGMVTGNDFMIWQRNLGNVKTAVAAYSEEDPRFEKSVFEQLPKLDVPRAPRTPQVYFPPQDTGPGEGNPTVNDITPAAAGPTRLERRLSWLSKRIAAAKTKRDKHILIRSKFRLERNKGIR